MSFLEEMKVQLKELADRLKLPNRTVTQALRLLEHLSKEHRSYVQRLKPLNVSASCLYLVGLLEGGGPRQRELCRAADWKISEATIRKHYRNIGEKLQLQPLLAIYMSRRLPRQKKYFCPLCGESRKNLDLWKSHLERDHHLRRWGQSMVRAGDFDPEGTLTNSQILKRIQEAERQWAKHQEMLDWIEETIGK